MKTNKHAGEPISRLVDRAQALEEQGSLNEALEYWQAAIQEERDPVFLLRFGRLAMKTGKLDEAREALLNAVDLAPKLHYPYEYLGMWHTRQGDLEQAISYYKKGLRVKATAYASSLLGAALFQLGRVVEARKSFRKALKIDPNYEEAYYNLGITYAFTQPNKAIPLFRKALKLDPECARTHSELGQALRRLNRNGEAKKHLSKAIKLDETDAWAHIYLGNVLWLQGRVSSAEDHLKKALELRPECSTPYWCLAMFYQYQGLNEEAEKLYRQAVAIDPDDPEANKRFGLYLKDIGETAKATKYLKRSLTHRPNDQSVRAILLS
jgi:tetratricopeptide (TPR) repeat protein